MLMIFTQGLLIGLSSWAIEDIVVWASNWMRLEGSSALMGDDDIGMASCLLRQEEVLKLQELEAQTLPRLIPPVELVQIEPGAICIPPFPNQLDTSNR